MASLGYRLADATLGAMMMSYDADRTGNLGFDEYLQAMSELTLFTNLFRTHDTSSTGGEGAACAGRAMQKPGCRQAAQLPTLPPAARLSTSAVVVRSGDYLLRAIPGHGPFSASHLKLRFCSHRPVHTRCLPADTLRLHLARNDRTVLWRARVCDPRSRAIIS